MGLVRIGTYHGVSVFHIAAKGLQCEPFGVFDRVLMVIDN